MINTDTASLYQKIAVLLEVWGSTGLPNGKTLSETMTVQGIPLWGLMCPELAIYILPRVFLSKKEQASVLRRLRPYFGRAKQSALEYFTAKRGMRGCIEWPIDPTILILGFSPIIYLEVLEPVAMRLSSSGLSKNIIIVDSWPEKTKHTDVNGSGIHNVWQHWNRETELHHQTMLGELKEVSAELKSMRALEYVLKKEEKLLISEMQAVFRWLFIQRLPQLLPHAAVASHILERHKPTLIVSGDVADPRTRFYYLFGKRFNIPSIEIQYGLALPDSVEHRFSLADRVAAFGEQSRSIMIEYGVPSERITVTGSPRHDKLVNDDFTKESNVHVQFEIPKGHAIVLFAASYYIPGYSEVKRLGLKITEDLFAAADRSSKLTLIVKPHPILNQANEIIKIAGKRRNIVFADHRANIHDLIRACDAFISLGSTTTLDAMIANKVTITPAYPGWFGNDQFIESGATMVPRSAIEIAQILDIASGPLREKTMAALEPARRRFLHKWVLNADGKATDRIAEIIRAMTQTSAKNQS
ncbi:MAG: hypothetical protein C0399_09350 [Syntrophus sp. (in: bacteria)]|nr:hypothetical protein [Syntrophus sp. (in: bacteria)]